MPHLCPTFPPTSLNRYLHEPWSFEIIDFYEPSLHTSFYFIRCLSDWFPLRLGRFPQSCWNCGRKATETCSGCNVARYCGSFCQHKDWENHHHVCGQHAQSVNEDNAHSSSGTAPTATSPKASSRSTSPASTRMTTPTTSSSDPISSLSDYVMKTPSTWGAELLGRGGWLHSTSSGFVRMWKSFEGSTSHDMLKSSSF